METLYETKEETFEIAGRAVAVKVTQYDSLEALDLMATLLDVIAPAASVIIVGLARGAEESVMGVAATLDHDEVANALRGTVGRISSRAARDALIFKVFQGTRCIVPVGSEMQILQPTAKERNAAIFGPDLMGMFRVMAFALQVQYGNFSSAVFGAYLARLAEAATLKEAAAAAAKQQQAAAST